MNHRDPIESLLRELGAVYSEHDERAARDARERERRAAESERVARETAAREQRAREARERIVREARDARLAREEAARVAAAKERAMLAARTEREVREARARALLAAVDPKTLFGQRFESFARDYPTRLEAALAYQAALDELER